MHCKRSMIIKKFDNRSDRNRIFTSILRTRNVSRSSITMRWSPFHAIQDRVNQLRYLNLFAILMFKKIDRWASISFTSVLNYKLPTDTILKRTSERVRDQHVGEVPSVWSDSVTSPEKSVHLSTVRTSDALEHSQDWDTHTQDLFTNRSVPVITSLKT